MGDRFRHPCDADCPAVSGPGAATGEGVEYLKTTVDKATVRVLPLTVAFLPSHFLPSIFLPSPFLPSVFSSENPCLPCLSQCRSLYSSLPLSLPRLTRPSATRCR